ncbi:heavy metal-associated isoprenylated plant protein 37 [Heracleum sosnowskyi]|uniref:Heavy metal-associated isoprenylated plant protein 37 n=1 Tax=Heracleum sosnowskyi TaxID=360622 RepID=A0AAD8HZ85_9APIA|nr:heavy metal-associated isoprenylated plant protein 37 [Heracleum sosnowskyi]
MTKGEDFKLLKIQTVLLRVNIHCDGCKQKVKKLLQRIEGVFQVLVDTEQQKVSVSGCVDSATLIKRLIRAGKHAELWSNKPNQNQNQNQKQKASCIKDDRNNKGQKQQHKYPNLSFLEGDAYLGEEDEDEYNRLNLLIQQTAEANQARQMLEAVQKGNMNNQGGKRGNQNQNAGMNVHAGVGLDPKILDALKLNNVQFASGNPGEIRRGGVPNENFAGFQGNNNSIGAAAPGGIYQMQPTGGIQGGSSKGLNLSNYPAYSIDSYPQQFNNPAMLMNLQNRQVMMQPQAQPQMMYQRSSVVPPSTTGYYYNYNQGAYAPYNEPVYYTTSTGGAADQSASHMFSDENTSGCSIM